VTTTSNGIRAIALAGPAGAGKTSLAEAMLFASGTITRQGSVEAGSCVGDASAEARARGGSTELNLMRYSWLDDGFALLDTPGAPGFAADGYAAMASADMVLVVVDPDPARAPLVEPVLRQIDALGVPHAIFVNKVDQAKGSISELLGALQAYSAEPLVARQIPIREGDRIAGFVDLALERAFHYEPGKPSVEIAIPADVAAREAHDRLHMLEQLADHDDALLEQLLADETPGLQTVLDDLITEMRANQIVPVLFGSAANGWGVRRLMKMLRHEAPGADETAARLGTNGNGLHIFKIANGGAVGRLALARVLGETLSEGAEIEADGETIRLGALFTVQGDKTSKVAKAGHGEVIAIAKADSAKAGMLIGAQGHGDQSIRLIEAPARNAALAIATRNRNDDVKLSTALHKLVEEDPTLDWAHDEVGHATILRGINDEHLAVTLQRLKRRYGIEVDTHAPRIAYKESIRKTATQRGRHKKQSGGHGQYGDCVIEVSPLERGAGFQFTDTISGGAIPKQWIPAVDHGVRDAMEKGPLGFPVVDVAVNLSDGSFHAVDSSELAFRLAGRLAMSEALAQCAPYLLEPVCHITVSAPPGTGSKVGSVISARRGHILGLGAHPDWPQWEQVEAHIPEAGLHGLDAELRSLSHGLATYAAQFDHLAELGGKLADEVVKAGG
jgi:elongation factor G